MFVFILILATNVYAIKVNGNNPEQEISKTAKSSINSKYVTNACNKYGINRNVYAILGENGSIVLNSGKKFKSQEMQYFGIVEGQSVAYPLQKNTTIKLDNFHVDFKPNGEPAAYVTKCTVNNNGKISKLTSMVANDIVFPANIDNCYFYMVTYMQDPQSKNMLVGFRGYCN